MKDATPILLVAGAAILFFLFMRRNQAAAYATAPQPSRSPTVMGYASGAVSGLVSLGGAALKGAPPAAALVGNAANAVVNTGAGVITNATGAALSIPNSLIKQSGGLARTTLGEVGSTAKSAVHTISFGLF